MGEDNTGETDNWLQIRTMRADDVDQVLDMWRELGRHRDLDNLNIFYQADPEGFFVAIDTRSGRLVATCCCAVVKELQGRGLGLRLWKTTIRRMGDSNASLNCYATNVGLYRDRAGFALVEPWVIVVFTSSAVTADRLPEPSKELRVVSVGTLLPQVIAYDRSVHRYDRTEAVTLTVRDSHGLTKAVVRCQAGRDVVCGFGRIGRCVLGGAILGPVYAESADVAGALLRVLVEGYPLARNGLCMKVPGCNPGGCGLARSLGFVECSEVLRCYRKEKTHARVEQIYALHDNNFCTF
ncbi:hypothetical protein HPB47_021193 [Ixodes persulcatus]|uniref:Uncharacterized protein n=1 Tax=Ixodes persulcatus TaxID=34615 RepID=A0AC60QD82_IXOPE|nr:hypothetical protein HPB47_021193 [Ixodes persulcatus]